MIELLGDFGDPNNPVNPFTLQNGFFAFITVVITAIVTWMAKDGIAYYKSYLEARKIARQDRIDEDKKVSQNRLDIRKAEMELDQLKEGSLEQGYKFLLQRRDEDIAAAKLEHRKEVEGILSEMKSIREEHKKEMAAFRRAHEECIEEHARAATERDSLRTSMQEIKTESQKRYDVLNQKYENLKRRVGGSDAVSELAPDPPKQ